MPLWYVWPTAFQTVIRACKTLFVMLLTHMFSVFALSEIVISFGGMDGQCVDAEQFVQRDALGRVVGLDLPSTGIWVGNHQIYTDWVYMWSLSLFAGLAGNYYIVLKDTGLYFCIKSLRSKLDHVYLLDFTIAYEGVQSGTYAPEFFTIASFSVVSPPLAFMSIVTLCR
ncbi:uncharacterized protein MJAP1_003491 [Malassezia japonica]|uniref:Uncharacterized protein n=1 Tax=Malassezia japonica TaxID=223818 RepID=A0AAF0F457_9BASI|nr:uncharacterized protein MJAP1_003491 [Malassezia japonica]WFD40505.1 hypothetical protein MJAP1_003491 [Malassezia japonica]